MKNLPVIYLKPGELHISSEPSLVTTVLGSCVSVTMFNRRLGIGAICHGMLPECSSSDSRRCLSSGICKDSCRDCLKYVDCSIYSMIGQFQKLGIGSNEIEVKLFGGANVLQVRNGADSNTVGNQNIKKAMQVINSEKLKLTASDVGGERGYKIIFYPHTGEVMKKRIKKGIWGN